MQFAQSLRISPQIGVLHMNKTWLKRKQLETECSNLLHNSIITNTLFFSESSQYIHEMTN